MKSSLITVTGLVQGVGFRWSTKRLADQNNITGWVRNDQSGAVIIRAEGADPDMAIFLSAIKHGPSPFARIDSVTVTSQAPESFRQFFISN